MCRGYTSNKSLKRNGSVPTTVEGGGSKPPNDVKVIEA